MPALHKNSLMKLPEKYSHFIFGIIQSCLTCAIVATINNAQGILREGGVIHWINSFLLSWAVMVPVVIFIAPYVRKLTIKLTQP